MSTIGPYHPLPSDAGFGKDDRPQRDGERRDTAGGRDAFPGFHGQQMPDGQTGGAPGGDRNPDDRRNNLSARAGDFLNRLEETIKRQDDDAFPAPAASPPDADEAQAPVEDRLEDLQLLALGAHALSTLPLLTDIRQAGPPERESPAASRLQEVFDTIATRIEQTLRAELGVAPGGVRSISIDLGELAAGLGTVKLLMSANGLDVVLSGQAAKFAEGMTHATQALADRLSRRFGNRTVRVLARTAGAEGEGGGATGGAVRMDRSS